MKSLRTLGFLLCMCILLVSASYSASETPPATPVDKTKEPVPAVPPQAVPAVANALAEAASSNAQATPPIGYVLQRGDDIEIRSYNVPDLNAGMRIRPDGMISCVLLHEVQAAGLTPTQLTQLLTDGYSRHFRNPRLTVVVKSYGSENVFVGGEVQKPGAVAVRGDITTVQALMRAGGFKDSGSPETVTVVRTGENGKQEVRTLNVMDILQNRTPDLVLKPSDVVYVPKSYVNVYIGGEVTRPGLIPLTGDMTIMSAVIAAGGFRETARTDGVVLVRRGENGEPMMSKYKLNDVFQVSAHTKLQPFDVVFVPKSKVARVNKWIDQYIRQMSPAILSFGFSYLVNQQTGAFPVF